MTGEFDPSHEAINDMPDYAAQLQTLAVELEIPEDALSERGINVAVTLLEEHWHEHGDKSKETYKPYHDGEHPMNIVARVWRLIKIIETVIPDRFDSDMYELGMIASAGHDVKNESGLPVGDNERGSAERTGVLMREAGYEEEQITRVQDGIIATTVGRNEDGAIIQTFIRTGSKDLLKFVLAEADINGIIMEGVSTMVRDATNLYLEINHFSLNDFFNEPTRVVTFLRTQAGFLSDRLAVMDEDLSYYLSDEEKALISGVYDQEFRGHARDALAAARVLLRFSKLPEEMIGLALSKTEDMASSTAERFTQVRRHLVEMLTRSPRD